MKKVILILASMLVLMVSGCGEGSSSVTTNTQTVTDTTNTQDVTDVRGLTQFSAVPAIPES